MGVKFGICEVALSSHQCLLLLFVSVSHNVCLPSLRSFSLPWGSQQCWPSCSILVTFQATKRKEEERANTGEPASDSLTAFFKTLFYYSDFKGLNCHMAALNGKGCQGICFQLVRFCTNMSYVMGRHKERMHITNEFKDFSHICNFLKLIPYFHCSCCYSVYQNLSALPELSKSGISTLCFECCYWVIFLYLSHFFYNLHFSTHVRICAYVCTHLYTNMHAVPSTLSTWIIRSKNMPLFLEARLNILYLCFMISFYEKAQLLSNSSSAFGKSSLKKTQWVVSFTSKQNAIENKRRKEKPASFIIRT